MDYLAASGLEPQLAIPVIVVVVGALLVYVFGFQQSEEPSLEHLAVLQSTSSYKARSVSNTKSKSNSAPNKTKDKPAQNGNVVHEKARPVEKKKEVSTSNKENKPPKVIQTSSKKAKQDAVRPEDFDSGDWIQATSRKDKKKQVKKDEPKEIPSSPEKSRDLEKPKVAAVEETILQETQVQVQSQTTQTTPKVSPEKKAKKGAKDVSTTTGSSGPSSQEPSPVKQKAKVTETIKQQENKVPEVVTVNGVSEESEESSDASPSKKLSVSEDAPATEPKKGVVAFDEMGENVDAWEEAKSRGNKKRRARKD
ncbi:unnamed protein product [Orchesella dallaii]|uniref:Uncharacterized protein n=1 Tax=Orchesella dallaii TaxID=48710 RepID=A0ABP1QBG8_9HEXA